MASDAYPAVLETLTWFIDLYITAPSTRWDEYDWEQACMPERLIGKYIVNHQPPFYIVPTKDRYVCELQLATHPVFISLAGLLAKQT